MRQGIRPCPRFISADKPRALREMESDRRPLKDGLSRLYAQDPSMEVDTLGYLGLLELPELIDEARMEEQQFQEQKANPI